MIRYNRLATFDNGDRAIFFSEEDKIKIIEWLSRAANTKMTDKELINLLDEMKK